MRTAKTISIVLDDRRVEAREGEILVEVARREGVEIPTLCHDPRLEPSGNCRACLVEIDGSRRLTPACATRVSDGLRVRTTSQRLERHRQTLFSLLLADHQQKPAGCGTAAACELHDLGARYGALEYPALALLRAGREDRNRFIHFDPEKCIVCARCTRYCEEIEGVAAITLAGRGSKTTIATVDSQSLLDSSCELCGGCVAVCPTGALTEKMPLLAGAGPDREYAKVRTTCNYCGVGCQLDLVVDARANGGRGKVVKVAAPPPGTIPNDGNTCVKGRFAYEFIDHEDRLRVPLVRENGELRPASWDEALSRAAAGLAGVSQRHGADALGFVSSSRCTMEENYLVQKMARAVFHTNNVHQCAAT